MCSQIVKDLTLFNSFSNEKFIFTWISVCWVTFFPGFPVLLFPVYNKNLFKQKIKERGGRWEFILEVFYSKTNKDFIWILYLIFPVFFCFIFLSEKWIVKLGIVSLSLSPFGQQKKKLLCLCRSHTHGLLLPEINPSSCIVLSYPLKKRLQLVGNSFLWIISSYVCLL